MSLKKEPPKRKKQMRKKVVPAAEKVIRDPKSLTWEKHGKQGQKPLRQGALIRRSLPGVGNWEYGYVEGGFGMSSDTVGGAIFVRNAVHVHRMLAPESESFVRARKGHDAGMSKWHRDHDFIQRVKKAKKPKKEPKKKGKKKS